MGKDDKNHEQAAPSREDLEDGLKFNHIVGQTLRDELAQTNSRVFAVLDLLIAKGVVSFTEIEELQERQSEQAELSIEMVPQVQIAPVNEKYEPGLLTHIDCADRTDLCGAPCCRVPFPLSVEDLDEGAVRWDYFRPYTIAQREDGRCVHLSDDRRCGIYDQRPVFCRLFDCRGVEEVWTDFEAKIVSPDVDDLGRPTDS